MGSSRSRTFYVVLFAGLVTLALRPVPTLERVLDLLLSPLRALAELSAPIGWLQGQGVRAAEHSLDLAEDELAAHRALERAVLDSALPATVQPAPHVRLINAEVVGREAHDLDRVRIRIESPSTIVVGLPVVSGDWYVGVVDEVPRGGSAGLDDVVTVQLVTDADARVGGRVRADAYGPESYLVVGGLAAAGEADHLDVHNPSDRRRERGRVEVHEPTELSEESTRLADGFLLGDLEREEHAVGDVLGLRPGLDYASGLFQVLVLAPSRLAGGGAVERPSALEDGAWRSARLVLRGEPSSWREGAKLTRGLHDGVVPGAAIVSGAELVGRVERAGLYGADVRMVGDPGFEIAALAMLHEPEGDRPHVLGRLVGLGRDQEGAVRFEWHATLPVGGEGGPVPATVWTGSGERGVPRGLRVGSAALPRGGGTHVLQVEQGERARRAEELFVRLQTGEIAP